MSSDIEDRPRLNRVAVVGLVVSALVAIGALFILPWLRTRGVSFSTAFLVLSVIEFLAAIGVTASILYLYDRGPIE